jgi:ligand-binding SRPBCC domain-containing protein
MTMHRLEQTQVVPAPRPVPKAWHHLHEFREVSGGTEMRDVVDYELPLGPLGDLAHAVAVKRTLSRIFAFRRQAVDSAFPPR